jgi:dihydroorotate dehydrogenase
VLVAITPSISFSINELAIDSISSAVKSGAILTATGTYLPYCSDSNFATYITVKISSPNTPGLRSLQYGEALNELLSALKIEQKLLSEQYGKYVPVAVKIAPDLTAEEIESIASSLIENEIDGVIATNTTLSREGVENHEFAEEQGGLSGQPVKDKSTQVIKLLSHALDNKLPIIGVGGIASSSDANEKLNAGASLVQVYTGFIYQGPPLVKDIVNGL